ncbi:SacI homology domain-containing protein [Choanephora cucurbitarum]|nr:SacI homology domain-containing protein [Choanephora cucurbitarum]
MHCISEKVDIQTNEVLPLYITNHSFILKKKEDNYLEILFEGQKMIEKDSIDSKEIIQQYDIYGVLGFIEAFKGKYMLVITSVQLRGHLMGHPVYVIDGISCLSLDASKACQQLDLKVIEHSVEQEVEERRESEGLESPKEPTEQVRPVQLTHSNSFMTRIKQTFSSKQTKDPEQILFEHQQQHQQEELLSALKQEEVITATSNLSSSSSLVQNEEEEDLVDDEDNALEQRLLRQVTEMFSKSMFLYSNSCDITNSFQRSYDKSKQQDSYDDPKVPLCQKVDKRFWWNEHLSRDFLDQKMDQWVVPVMQGTLQIEPCHIEGYVFDFVLISRRSRERAGMRYQRRGINEDGQVANFVETEQCIIFKRDQVNHVAAFVQTRGSIPVFWSQSPYSLHPIPVLDRSEQENHKAFEKHFETQEDYYGKQILVNLTELLGREAIVGSEYRKHVEELADPNIKYVEFDFHKETKGMKFENISKLSKSLHDDLFKMQYFWETDVQKENEPNVYCRQTGVFRTNCMDCLDRTNVVQSAFGRSVLNLQLMRFGISEYPEQGIKYYDGFERIFNNVWANNGDMISRMYAGTSALKGDFTRTGKRNITGMMNDASNSLARMYFNTIKDFWRQATVDYILGYHKVEIFRHVPQSTNMSAEPGLERRWAKIRSNAIDISSEIVVADDETRLAGWTLLSPTDVSNARKFEEKVVLLTEKALYICSYNYDLEKVIQFKRLALKTIHSIQMGEYILSSLTPASRSEDQNYGMILRHSTDGELVRWNTGSIHNLSLVDINIDPKEEEENEDEESQALATLEQDDVVIFKAVRYNVLGELDGEVETCKEQIKAIVREIAKATGHMEDADFIIHKPIISLEQAQKTDGIFKKMGYRLKQAIWM